MNRKKNIRYDSDDFSRMAGPDYRQGPAENFELGDEDPVSSRGTNSYPGVSGKTLRGGTWFNHDKYDKQRKFMGKGPKGYRRSDDRIYEEVCEVLTRSHDLDASDIGVTVQHGTVILEGHVDSKKNKIFAEYLITDLPGVEEIKNDLKVDNSTSREGPEASTFKDLGIGEDQLNR